MRAPRRKEGGFTLLEVVVAMALLAAGIVALYSLYSGALRLSAGSRDASASSIYARQRMEEALLVPNPVGGVERGTFGDRYRWEVETSFVPEAEESPFDEVRVRVTVAWKDGGDERAVDLFATHWPLKDRDIGDLSGGSAQRQPGVVPEDGGIQPKPAPGSGGIQPKPAPGGIGYQGGQSVDDYLPTPTQRRWKRK